MFINFIYKGTTMRRVSALALAASTVCFGLPSMAQNIPCLVWIAPGACGVEDTLHPDHPRNQRRDPQPSYDSAPNPLADEIGRNFARALGEIFSTPSPEPSGQNLFGRVASPDGELNFRDQPNLKSSRIISVLRDGDRVAIQSCDFFDGKQYWCSIYDDRNEGYVVRKYLVIE